MNLFTVITVTYNAQDTLLQTLKSVQEQTYPHIEHIIVDGASTDNTVAIIKQHESEQTRWISEKDNGIYDAMNKATQMANGMYICYLNAGDSFYSHCTIEQIMETAQQYHWPHILYGETVIVNDQYEFLHNRRLKAPQVLTWESFKQGMLVCHQAFIIKRSIFEPYDLSFHYSSDVDWCIRLLKKSKSVVNTHLTLIRYLNQGTTTANRKASLIERFQIMKKHYGALSTLLHHAWFVVRAIIKPEKKIQQQ